MKGYVVDNVLVKFKDADGMQGEYRIVKTIHGGIKMEKRKVNSWKPFTTLEYCKVVDQE